MSYKRVKFDQHGDPAKVLSFEVVSGIPTPADDEIVVQVTASPIDPYDFVIVLGIPIAYGPPNPSLPASPGCEGVGRVHAMGKNVTGFSVGQRVAFFSHTGAWSEYVVLKTSWARVIPVPDALPDSAAGQLFINPYTAYGLIDHSNPSKDDWIMQTGAGSVLGQMVIELAKIKGLNLINVVRRKAQIEELKARYGSDIHVVAFDGSNEAEALAEVNAITNNKGVNIVFEAVAGKTFDFALKALARHGHVLSFGALSRSFDIQLSVGLLLQKTPKIEGFVVTPWWTKKTPEEAKKITEELISLMVSKKLVPALESVHPLENFGEALGRSFTPSKQGRVFLAAHPEKVTK